MPLPHHCPHCGSANVAARNRSVGRCDGCERELYANSKPTAGAIIERAGRLCLVRRAQQPGLGKLDFPGGYLDEGEYPEDGCRRELREELGIEIGPLRPAFIELNDLGELVAFDVMYEAVAPEDQVMQPGSDAAVVAWYAFDEVPVEELAFDSTRRIFERWRASRVTAELTLLGGTTLDLTSRPAVARFDGASAGLPRGWQPECGAWSVHDGAVCGRIEDEAPAALWCETAVTGDHALEILAWTVPPHGNDINCFWEGSGTILSGGDGGGGGVDDGVDDGDRDVACTISGVGGWWDGRSGIERHPAGGLRATGRSVELIPGRSHRIVAGRCGDTDFLFLDGRLVVQLDAPGVTRRERSRVALATWNSHVHFASAAVHEL